MLRPGDDDARATRRARVRCSASRSLRSSSTNTTTDPESLSPYSSSGPVHHALSGTTTAPNEAAAQNAIDHSGKFRIAIGDAISLLHPEVSGEAVRHRRRCGEVLVERERLVLVHEERQVAVCTRLCSSTARNDGGAFFHVRVATPLIRTSSISKGWPGAVSAAWTSATEGGMGAVWRGTDRCPSAMKPPLQYRRHQM